MGPSYTLMSDGITYKYALKEDMNPMKGSGDFELDPNDWLEGLEVE